MTDGKFTPATVALILDRDGGRCWWCRRHVLHGVRGFDWSIHHRCPRGMGGTTEAFVGAASNGIILCGNGTQGCHGEFESDRGRAIDLGVLVPRIAAFRVETNRPPHIPIHDRDGLAWLLTDDGAKVPAEPGPGKENAPCPSSVSTSWGRRPT
ncbi:hypothetical protein QE418_003433 [Microbacterium testaceum]|uniref:HNH endonuclease n=1 Tax=Microbacterium TaxID=33882 RepID=UPI00277D7244|nr:MULTISPECIES: hypothetical protein [Microbacterium]MDQ1113985.1 hypothetical protein [Microbacterium testaceum]MDR6098908.1 hypothetical protein [Microbacterium sp. SORGH_AS_0454]